MKTKGYDSIISWCVAFGCFFITMATHVGFRLSGLFYVIFIEHFDISREKASYPIVTFVLLRTFGAPLIAILGEKFGVEEITLLGTLFAAVGFAGCYFVNELVGVIIFLGIVYGIGLCGSTAMQAVIIKRHFTKNTSTANGITLAGSCIGAFFFPALAMFLLEKYGVSGTFLITSAIMLNAVPVAMLIMTAGKMLAELNLFENKHTLNVEEINSKEFSFIQTVTKNSNSEMIQKNEYTTNKLCVITSKNKLSSASLDSLHKADSTVDRADNSSATATKLSLMHDNQIEHSLLESQQQIAHNLNEIRTPKSLDNYNNFEKSCDKDQTKISKNGNIYRSLKIFVEPNFLLIMLNVGLHSFVILLFWTTMIDYSRDKGISRNYEVYFLTFQPFSDLIGRLGLGWITDHNYMTLFNFAILCYCLMGLSCGLVLWSTGFEMMFISALIFGLFSGAVVSCGPEIICKLMKEDKQSMAMTSRQLFFGVFVCTASSVIGFFRETLGSYDGLYYLFIVLCIMSSAVMFYLQRIVIKRQKITE